MSNKNETNDKKQMEEYTIVMLGTGGVGKTSITLMFVKNKFDNKYNPTIEDSFSKFYTVDNTAVKINILDTAGQEEYTGLRDQHMREGDGFVFVYDITNQDTFIELEALHDQLLNNVSDENVPIILAGNKCDLEQKRSVSKEEAQKFVSELGEYAKFIEVSAKDGKNVDEIYQQMVRMIRSHKQKKDNKDKSNDSVQEHEKKPTKKRTWFVSYCKDDEMAELM